MLDMVCYKHPLQNQVLPAKWPNVTTMRKELAGYFSVRAVEACTHTCTTVVRPGTCVHCRQVNALRKHQ